MADPLPRYDSDSCSVLCWIEVDLDAVADNVRALQAAAQPRAGVTAVVKAQAYGMGAAAVARAAVAGRRARRGRGAHRRGAPPARRRLRRADPAARAASTPRTAPKSSPWA